MPIANASILVAIAMVNTTFGFAGLNSLQHSSSLKDSKIIRPPKKARIAKAIQWSMGARIRLKSVLTYHPAKTIAP